MTEIETDTPTYQPFVDRRTRVLPIRGIDYSINEWGSEDSPALFFLHGWADCGGTFQFVADVLASKFRVVAPDWRGFGHTAGNGQSYWFPDYLADLHEILNHYSADEPVNLVGHSMGGNVCSLYAGVMPERVRALVNLEGFGLTDSDPVNAPLRYRRWLLGMDKPPVFGTFGSFDELALRIQKRSPALDEAHADFVARQWAYDDGDRIRLRADPLHKLPNPVLYRRAEAEACWREITANVVLVCGADSPFVTQSSDIEALPFPNRTTCTIPGAGHMLHFEAPSQVADLILKFFK